MLKLGEATCLHELRVKRLTIVSPLGVRGFIVEARMELPGMQRAQIAVEQGAGTLEYWNTGTEVLEANALVSPLGGPKGGRRL